MNPDLDGVASALVYASYLADHEATPYFEGTLNDETSGVLSALGLLDTARFAATESQSITSVVLVDCHHPAQLPPFVTPTEVTLIVDHHPDGQPDAFPNATIQNETVGAAATLIAERVARCSDRGLGAMTPAHSALLACAIASNTLDFSAPSTTARDNEIYRELKQGSEGVDLDGLVAQMGEWRRGVVNGPTRDAVRKDVKTIDSPIGKIFVSQLEAGGASALLDRPDLSAEFDALFSEGSVQSALLSLVDTDLHTTHLYSSDERVLLAFSALNPARLNSRTLRLPFIALRKTHVIPALMKMQAVEPI